MYSIVVTSCGCFFFPVNSAPTFAALLSCIVIVTVHDNVDGAFKAKLHYVISREILLQ